MRVACLASLVVVFVPAPARACDPARLPSRFELVEEADAVIVAKPTAAPRAWHAGTATLALDTVVKGSVAKTIDVRLDGTDCDPTFTVGEPTLVWLRDGRVLEGFRGELELAGGDRTPVQPWLAYVRRWHDAGDDATRAGIATNAIAEGGELASDGILVLRSRRELVRALERDHVAVIARAWPHLHGGLRAMLRELPHPALQRALAAAARAERARRRQRPGSNGRRAGARSR